MTAAPRDPKRKPTPDDVIVGVAMVLLVVVVETHQKWQRISYVNRSSAHTQSL